MKVLRLLPLAIVGVLGAGSHAEAALITVDVAEVTWILEGDSCTSATPDDCNSVFTLSYLWTVAGNPGPLPAPTVSGSLDVDGTPIDFFDVNAGSPIDMVSLVLFGISGVPATASATISFNFPGPRSIGPQGLAPITDLFSTDGTPSALGIATLFSFEYDDSPAPIPEPSTLALVAAGLVAARRRALRARRTQR